MVISHFWCAPKNNTDMYVASRSLRALVKSLNVCLRRYHMTRKERAITVNSKSVAGE